MKKKLTNIARRLRKKQTPHEIKLWFLLRRHNFFGLKFRRQCPIGNHIVDFCCPQRNLIIELDGGDHNQDKQIKKDLKRDKFLKGQGFKILRIWNNELDNNLEGVFERISELTN